MRTRDNDTVPDPRPPQESSSDSSDPGVSGGSSAKSASREYISEPEPMDLLLRKVVQATPDVPNSLEPGIAYQATHAPAAPYGRPELAERVLVQATTEPGARPVVGEDGSLPRLQVETMAIPRHRLSANKVAMLAFASVVAIGGAVAFAVVMRPTTRDDRLVAAAPTSASAAVVSTPSPRPSSVSPVPVEPPPPPVTTLAASITTVAASVTASTPRVGRLPPQPASLMPRPRPAPANTEVPPSSLMNQSPL
jgi:hypothetical protein